MTNYVAEQKCTTVQDSVERKVPRENFLGLICDLVSNLLVLGLICNDLVSNLLVLGLICNDLVSNLFVLGLICNDLVSNLPGLICNDLVNNPRTSRTGVPHRLHERLPH